MRRSSRARRPSRKASEAPKAPSGTAATALRGIPTSQRVQPSDIVFDTSGNFKEMERAKERTDMKNFDRLLEGRRAPHGSERARA